MKKQIGLNLGFTLVELIVVITILAILGTIGFVSFQGYSVDARNTKRTSDIGNLAKVLAIKNIEGMSLESFVKGTGSVINSNSGTYLRISGRDGYDTLSGSYKAGDVNYQIFDVKEDDFYDPKANVPYKIGTTTFGGRYEIAASIENEVGGDTIVVGNYSPRLSSTTRGLVGSTNGDIVYLSGSTVNETGLKVNDIVYMGTGATSPKYVIRSLKDDRIYLDVSITQTGEYIYLQGDETRHLIKRWKSTQAIDEGRGTNEYTPYEF